MSTRADRPVPVTLTVADRALAAVAAHVASDTPGVARLRPYGSRAVRTALAGGAARAVRRRRETEPRAERAAITVSRDVDASAPVGVEVRLTATGTPVVIDTVESVQQRVTDEIARLTGLSIDPVVRVVGIEPSAAESPA